MPRVQDAIPSLDCRAWKGRSNPLLLTALRFAPESRLITRGRNKMVIKFLEDESLTHLFWIDSDIAFRPQSVCRLLLADRDVSAAVYPMKSFNWPEGGLPQGMTRREFELRFGEFPYNPIDHGKAASKFVDPTASSRSRRRRPASCASNGASSMT